MHLVHGPLSGNLHTAQEKFTRICKLARRLGCEKQTNWDVRPLLGVWHSVRAVYTYCWRVHSPYSTLRYIQSASNLYPSNKRPVYILVCCLYAGWNDAPHVSTRERTRWLISGPRRDWPAVDVQLVNTRMKFWAVQVAGRAYIEKK